MSFFKDNTDEVLKNTIMALHKKIEHLQFENLDLARNLEFYETISKDLLVKIDKILAELKEIKNEINK